MTTIKQLAGQLATTVAFGLVASLSASACDLDVPDLNNPGLGELQDTPTAALINSACTGLFIGGRRNVAAENGYVSELGILGREAYNFDSADPRDITEMIVGALKGSSFGANFWAGPYTNIQLANIILAGATDLRVHREVLHGLHVERDSLDLG